MIDTNELRRLAQAATPGPWRIGAMESGRVAIDGVNGSEVTGFIDPEDGHLILAAANPATISGLLDRLEAAERDVALKEKVIDALGSELNAVAKERIVLRAKISEMERQKPIGTVHAMPGAGAFTMACFDAQDIPVGAMLYALPGAQTQGDSNVATD